MHHCTIIEKLTFSYVRSIVMWFSSTVLTGTSGKITNQRSDPKTICQYLLVNTQYVPFNPVELERSASNNSIGAHFEVVLASLAMLHTL